MCMEMIMEIGYLISKLEENGIVVDDFSIPYKPDKDHGEKVTLFIKPVMDDENNEDYMKLLELESFMFMILEEDLNKSKYFHMVGLL